MHLVRLLASQRRVQNIKHPLLDGCAKYSVDELEEMVGGDPEALILALRSLVRNLVGRYCCHWPCTRRFEDDMVGEAMMAVVKLVGNTVYIEESDRDIMYLASSHVRRAIERMLNDMQSNAAPSFTVQEGLARNGKDPIFLSTARDLEPEDASTDSQESLFDTLEVIAKLRLDYELANKVMDPANWHLNDTELAAKIGSPRISVQKCRQRLLTQYKEAVGETS